MRLIGLFLFGFLITAALPAAASFEQAVDAFDRGDYKTAYELWLPAARNDDPAAQRNIGHMFRRGLGVEQDYAEAVRWYKRAAELGLAAAQVNLAVMLMKGQGSEPQPRRAAVWFHRAAVQGHVLAQYNLGLLYARGSGVEKDRAIAVGWLYKAAEAGHVRARQQLDALLREADRENLERAAEERAREQQQSTPPSGQEVRNKDAQPDQESGSKSTPTIGSAAPTKAGSSAVAEADQVGTQTASSPDSLSSRTLGAVGRLFGIGDDDGEQQASATPAPESSESDEQATAAQLEDIAPAAGGNDPASTPSIVPQKGANGKVGKSVAAITPSKTAPKNVSKPTLTSQGLAPRTAVTLGSVAFNAQDYETALEHWQSAADIGFADAQFRLGTLFETEQFQGKNLETSKKWYQRAAQQGHSGAISALERLAR